MSNVTIKGRKGGSELNVSYEFPKTLGQAVSMFGEEVVLNRLNRQVGQELRASVIRQVNTNAEAAAKKVKKGETPVPLDPSGVAKLAAANFKPTLTSGTTRAVKTIDKALASLTDEDRAQVLKALATTEAAA